MYINVNNLCELHIYLDKYVYIMNKNRDIATKLHIRLNFYKHNDEKQEHKHVLFVIMYKSIKYYKNTLTMNKNESRIQPYQRGK